MEWVFRFDLARASVGVPMSFIAQADLVIDGSPGEVFDRLVDFASWPTWMPRSFVPVVRAGQTTLRLGERFRVRIAGTPLPSTLRVSACDRPRELAWRGGVRGLLWANHRFVFEPEGAARTRVRSIETWHGALAGVLRGLIEPRAAKIGAQQLAGLARGVATARGMN